MKKCLFLISLLLSLPTYNLVFAQSEAPTKLSVNDRLIKARAAKAQKRVDKTTGAVTAQSSVSIAAQTNRPSAPGVAQAKAMSKPQKATAADLKMPIDKSKHGPNGEVIYTGARGAKYYINKNGNKTYLSSNQ